MAKSNILALAFTTIIATTSIQAQAFIPTDSFEIAGNLFQACTDDRYTACVAYLEGVADIC